MPELKSRLLVVTDRRETKGRPLLSVLDHAMSGGRLAIQLRERDLPTQDLLALARDVAARAQTRNAQLLINDRADVALTLEGAGVHLRASSLPVSVTRR
ncbi:MAG TPA: thiamine phosphate synthase, partial [Nitrospira sp.]|nr:thiamine phosphate synthase [Nitrospira sp.]